ncbi:glycosyltransferase [Atopobacter sp. AH10]|uniref:glycosyltransferase family 4 protein n=1 Tax=Atopobacter sp. AH10 TaxID=2315861 RepID=UPI000EF1A62B|nr:glycosyltransferase family 4 protein [Atopobacter sp. AH10]RLK63277.1 glycosyltransferase [Atopobacter sp. AH10]
MKILHVIAQLPMKTGSGVYASNLIEGLEEKGYENAVIYGIQDPFKAEFSEAIQKYPVKFLTEELPFPIVGMSDDMPYTASRYKDLKDDRFFSWKRAFLGQLERAKKDFCPDLVISHHLWCLTRLVKDVFFDRPVIGICHATDLRQAQNNPLLKKAYANDFSDLSQVIALSQKNIPLIGKTFGVDPSKIRIIPGGFDQLLFYEAKDEVEREEIKIFYGGKISHAKGVFELAAAFKQISQVFEKAHLYIVGNCSQEEEDELYQLAGQTDRIHFAPAVEQKKFAAYLREMDIFALASYYEGVPLVAIEALACGTRVVVSAIAGLIETLEDDINDSSLIEYVDLPRMIGVDVPHPEDIDDYIDRLALALSRQIIRIQEKEVVPKKVKEAVEGHSFGRTVNAFSDLIQGLNLETR